jgi:hypothetical protein
VFWRIVGFQPGIPHVVAVSDRPFALLTVGKVDDVPGNLLPFGFYPPGAMEEMQTAAGAAHSDSGAPFGPGESSALRLATLQLHPTAHIEPHSCQCLNASRQTGEIVVLIPPEPLLEAVRE